MFEQHDLNFKSIVIIHELEWKIEKIFDFKFYKKSWTQSFTKKNYFNIALNSQNETHTIKHSNKKILINWKMFETQ